MVRAGNHRGFDLRRSGRDGAPIRFVGEDGAIIHLDNPASKNVVRKMGFKYWMQAPVQGEVRAVYRLRLGTDPHRGVSAGVVLAGQKRTQTSIGTPR